MDPRTDSQGNLRGNCTLCTCTGFCITNVKNKCANCPCKPIHHHILSNQPLQQNYVPTSPILPYNQQPIAMVAPVQNPSVPPTSSFSALSLNGQSTPICQFISCSAPCFLDNGRYLDFCGRTHAKAASSDASQRKQPTHNSMAPSFSPPIPSTVTSTVPPYSAPPSQAPAPVIPSAPICQIVGCTKTCHMDNGTYLEFCGKTHAKQAKKNPQQLKKNQSVVSAAPPVATAAVVVPAAKQCFSPKCSRQKLDTSVYCSKVCLDGHDRSGTLSRLSSLTV